MNKFSPIDQKLWEAIQKKDSIQVQKLLAQGANPNLQKGRQHALDLAETYRAEEIKAFLIEAGAESDSMIYSMVSTVNVGRLKAVQILLDKGADINSDTPMGTPIQVAARKGFSDIVDLLIARQADVDAGSSISTPLIDALENDHFDIALKLLKAGANPQKTPEFGDIPPIAFAAARGATDVLKVLLDSGVSVHTMTDSITLNRQEVQKQAGESFGSLMTVLQDFGKARENDSLPGYLGVLKNLEEIKKEQTIKSNTATDSTPVLLAARQGHTDAVEVLLKAGADPYYKDGDACSVFDWAIKNKDQVLLDMLNHAGFQPPKENLEDEKLLTAAEKGDLHSVQQCLFQKANIHARDQRRKTRNYTPLMLACAGQHHKVVEYLLKAGANVDLSDYLDTSKKIPDSRRDLNRDLLQSLGYSLGMTPLLVAVRSENLEIVQQLMQHGADPSIQNIVGENAFFFVAKNGNIPIAQCLLNAGLSLQSNDDNSGEDLLLVALHNMQYDFATFLINAGVALNGKDFSGETPLMNAVQNELSLDLIRLLIEKGANVNEVSSENLTALNFAEDRNNSEMIQLLKKYGGTKFRESSEPEEEEDFEEEDRIGPDIDEPNFSQVAKNPDFQKAVIELGELCGSTPVDQGNGWFSCHIKENRRKNINTESLQKQFLERGYFVYEPKYSFKEGPKSLNILPTKEKYEVIAFHGTSAGNYGIGTGYIIEWLKKLENEQPFILTCICGDTLSGRFLTPIQDPKKWANAMYDFCPDIVDQGCDSVENLEKLLCSKDHLYFWWD